ncbi:MAG: DUF4174 domain-containing protein [Verrucomicrobia bacterium]|nr:DUF4174 domain-containing protein [Cytophagales bacterium]
MKKAVFYLFTTLIFNTMQAQDFDVENYVWQKRVLLVFAPDAEHALFKQQMLSAKENQPGFKERDLVVISIFTTTGFDEKNQAIATEKVKNLRKKYKVSDNEFKVILLGKDGGEKQSSSQAFDSQQLFGIIDAMPMRKREKKD